MLKPSSVDAQLRELRAMMQKCDRNARFVKVVSRRRNYLG